MNRRTHRAALAGSLLAAAFALGGCAHTTTARFTPAESALPAAAPLDATHARKLYLLVIDGMRHDGQARAALAYLDDYDRVYPGDPHATLLRADCLLQTGQADQAEPLYRSLMSGAYAAAAQGGLGRVAARQGQWDEAATAFHAALRLDPSQAGYINDLGYVDLRRGRYDAALASLRQAAELQPGDLRTRNNLILALHLAGKDAEAQRIIRAIPDPAQRRAAEKLLHLSATALDAGNPVTIATREPMPAPIRETQP
ncbi:MAG: tetratricopeptide repeat protein [Rhodospirillales bacterium]|nr:tetratricopeptide repeat protein [Rhodospirillales bacterium]